MKDLTVRESVVLGSLVIAIVFTGLFPQPVIDKARPSIFKTIKAHDPAYFIAEKKNITDVVADVAPEVTEVTDSE